MHKFFIISLLGSLLSISGFAADEPGGLTRTAVSLPNNSYEMLLSPAYTIQPGGAYLSSEFRLQPNEDLGLGFGFGSGQIGFNFGVNGTWYVAPDLSSQPAFAILGGLYFNRQNSLNYCVLKITPILSKTFKTEWGKVTPYGGIHLSPSFGIGTATNEFAIKTSTGVEFAVTDWSGLHLWTEFGLGIFNSAHEVVLGLSFPFSAFEG